jgi:fucose permease
LLPFFAASFIAFGVVLVLPGVHQADLARSLELDLARSGLLASALAAGLGVGVIGAGPLFDRMRRRPLFIAAFGIAAAALLSVRDGMAFERWLVHVAAAGFGIGFYDTLINAAVAERYRAAAARPMSLVHAAATVGAMAAPLLAALVAGRGGFVASFHWAGAAHVVLGVWACVVAFPDRGSDGSQSPVSPGAGATALDSTWRLALTLVPLAAVAFAYVGVEASLTVFAVPYATGALALPAARGATAISALWLGLLLGRVGVLGLPHALGARTLVGAGALAACALLGGVGLRLGFVEATFLATGVALGCVYPLTMALVGERVPEARGTAAGLAAGAGALGGSAVPWLTGSIGDAAGVSLALASLAGWCAAISVAAGAARGIR